MTEAELREQMVREQVEARGVAEPRVLEAMRRVERHLFVPEPLRAQAYDDRPQPIGAEQTISQPLMVGAMTALLDVQPGHRVLEIGTGSGYQAAILAELGAEVITIERHPPLAERAGCLLEYLGYRVQVLVGDGTLGHLPAAPYDRILVTAAAPQLPAPLIAQLAPAGHMVIPVGKADLQQLFIVRRDAAGNPHTEYRGDCIFVPLIGAHAWPA